MHRRARAWTALAALATGATLAAAATAAHPAAGHPPAPPAAPQMCALLTQPHTPVPDQRCDSPGVGRWRLILD